MFDYVNEYLRRMKEDQTPGTFSHNVVRGVRCASGLELSIQASSGHYCSPKQDEGPWTHVEIGFPSRKLRTLAEWDQKDGIYAWVPVEKLNWVITKAGGIVHPIIVMPPCKKPLKRIPRERQLKQRLVKNNF